MHYAEGGTVSYRAAWSRWNPMQESQHCQQYPQRCAEILEGTQVHEPQECGRSL